MEEPGPLSLIEACCGSHEVRSYDLCKLLREACLVDESPDSCQVCRCSDSSPMKLSHVRLYQQVPLHGEFETFFHANHYFCGHNGVARIKERIRKNIALHKTCLRKANMGKT